ncbi:MAG TPA: hypothetical protein VMZ31_06895 [Phycisphaerae bacterium]|nr:hypothetical protein [Phycisphaerae bacterium]
MNRGSYMTTLGGAVVLRFGVLVALVGMASGSAVARAAESKETNAVELEVLTIVASNDDERIDPKLKQLAKQLKPTFRFSSYRLAGRQARSVQLGRTWKAKLVAPYVLEATPTAVKDDKVSLTLKAVRGTGKEQKLLLQLKIQLRTGKYQLCGGWPASGGTLIVAIQARTKKPPSAATGQPATKRDAQSPRKRGEPTPRASAGRGKTTR